MGFSYYFIYFFFCYLHILFYLVLYIYSCWLGDILRDILKLSVILSFHFYVSFIWSSFHFIFVGSFYFFLDSILLLDSTELAFYNTFILSLAAFVFVIIFLLSNYLSVF